MHENEYSNEMNPGMKLNGGITMNTGMKPVDSCLKLVTML